MAYKQLREIYTKSSTGAADIIPEVIHGVAIQESRRPQVFRRLAWNIDASNMPSDQYKLEVILKENFRFAPVGPGGEYPTGDITSVERVGTYVKWGRKAVITQEMIEDGKFDIVAENVAQLSEAAGRTTDGWIAGVVAANARQVTPAIIASGFAIPADIAAMAQTLQDNDYRLTDLVIDRNWVGAFRMAYGFHPNLVPNQTAGLPILSQGSMGGEGPEGTMDGPWGSVRVWVHAADPSGLPGRLASLYSGFAVGFDAEAANGNPPFAYVERRPYGFDRVVDSIRDLVNIPASYRGVPLVIHPSALVAITGVYQGYLRSTTDTAA